VTDHPDTEPCPAPPPTRPSNPRPTPDPSELMDRIEALAATQAAEMKLITEAARRFEAAERQLSAIAPDLALLAHEIRRHGGELCVLRKDVDRLPCRSCNGGVPPECPEAAE